MHERGLIVNPDYRKRRFRVEEEQPETVYLNSKEIEKLAKLNLSENPRLDKVRDLFLIGCATGLRFSDYNQVNQDHITKVKGGYTLSVRTSKTGENVIIPIGTNVLEIIKKYDFRLQKIPSNQKVNKSLKDLCKLAGFTETIVKHISKGDMRIESKKKKWEMISTHTARRSFATNAYLGGIPELKIMKITGHRTEKSFLRYIRISQEDNALNLIQHPFFKDLLRIAK